jgi:hypothetical protein
LRRYALCFAALTVLTACGYDWSLETVEAGAPPLSQGDGAGDTALLDGDPPYTALGDDGGGGGTDSSNEAAGSLSQHDASVDGGRAGTGGSVDSGMVTTGDSGTKIVDAETNPDALGGCDPGQTACGGACCPEGYPTCCVSCGSYHCGSGTCLEIECPESMQAGGL